MITSVGNPTIRRIRRLRKSLWRARTGLFLVEGHRPVSSALDAGARVEEMLVTGRAAHLRGSVLERARSSGVRTVEVSDAVMGHLTSVATAPDVLAVVAIARKDLTARIRLPAIVLCGVHDPAVAGGILAAAAASGCRTAVFGAATVDPFEAKVVRAAQGAHFLIDLIQATDDTAAIDAMRAAGARIVVLGDKGVSPWEIPLAGPTAFVIAGAGELAGVGDADLVAVPSGPVTPSLSARAAVLMYEWVRQNEAATR